MLYVHLGDFNLPDIDWLSYEGKSAQDKLLISF